LHPGEIRTHDHIGRTLYFGFDERKNPQFAFQRLHEWPAHVTKEVDVHEPIQQSVAACKLQVMTAPIERSFKLDQSYVFGIYNYSASAVVAYIVCFYSREKLFIF
jgi:hypothetical protein